jgi:hypothetical protein
LHEFQQTSSAEISEKLSKLENSGALPSTELDKHRAFSVSFAESWANHEEARSWAMRILKNRTTFAADASPDFAGTRHQFAGCGDSGRLV